MGESPGAMEKRTPGKGMGWDMLQQLEGEHAAMAEELDLQGLQSRRQGRCSLGCSNAKA